ncbi:hypothetical protein LDG_8808 [Legionella drancourtii LLAP12]|uniref:Uncharacterized protein n=1 Tax=Legionella drancourtii LLAP12 TaxID=658187 RepID=G9EU19_9GAMM|nr:hypothetical protein LDG_8808 [Legionella drancourtii LLAP12]
MLIKIAIMRKFASKGKEKLLQYKQGMYNNSFYLITRIAYGLLILQNY